MIEPRLALPNRAERSLIIAVALLCISGGWLSIESLGKLQAAIPIITGDFAAWWLGVAGAVGAAAAAYSARNSFGRSGRYGAMIAVVGGVAATLVLGIVGGTIVLPIYGTMFGPWLTVVSAFEGNTAIVPWAAALYGFHRAIAYYQWDREARGAPPVT